MQNSTSPEKIINGKNALLKLITKNCGTFDMRIHSMKKKQYKSRIRTLNLRKQILSPGKQGKQLLTGAN